ncbi:hypothetical protein EVAR_38371_1 [Eumeta japonica]|uniref:Uncharacterized protein n=1 Tax=Eumeta variegata TaxID=151549 RepID=A0A4C1XXQ4_EUMVA|nr:hypothetical protein EVAR_38371_1 [Eumeta japonica]
MSNDFMSFCEREDMFTGAHATGSRARARIRHRRTLRTRHLRILRSHSGDRVSAVLRRVSVHCIRAGGRIEICRFSFGRWAHHKEVTDKNVGRAPEVVEIGKTTRNSRY